MKRKIAPQNTLISEDARNKLAKKYNLQPRDIEVILFIIEFRKLGISPTYREIKDYFGLISTEQVARSTRRLKREGLLDNSIELDLLSRSLLPTQMAIDLARSV